MVLNGAMEHEELTLMPVDGCTVSESDSDPLSVFIFSDVIFSDDDDLEDEDDFDDYEDDEEDDDYEDDELDDEEDDDYEDEEDDDDYEDEEDDDWDDFDE